MLLVGCCYGIRSERRLCEEVHLNLAYRWFCRLDLDGEVPDHSTFSKNRHGRFRDRDLLRKLFETVVRRCMAEGLVDGTAFAVDASLIAADANKQRSAAGSDDVDWEAVARTRRSVREYLDTLDEAAWGAASETVPKFISRSDPAAQWTGAHKGHAFFAYADNYLIDLKAAIIVDVEATRAIRQAEVGAARTMIERTEDRDVAAWTEKDRDAVRTSQAHPAPRPTEAERSVWCSRRVPPRRHRPEPPKAVKADPAARPNAGLSENKLTRA